MGKNKTLLAQMIVFQDLLVKGGDSFANRRYGAGCALIAAVGKRVCKSVRRQIIWPRLDRRLAECRPHLGVDVMRRACGAASADVGWFGV
jgi:hypothetical protein